MHARCMLEGAKRLASWRVDPRPCVACRSWWPELSPSPYPTEFANGLPVVEPGGEWSAVRGALHFADLLRPGAPGLEPTSYVTPSVYTTFEFKVRALQEEPNLLAPPVFPVHRCSEPNASGAHALVSPTQGNVNRLAADPERRSPRSGSEHIRSCFEHHTGGDLH